MLLPAPCVVLPHRVGMPLLARALCVALLLLGAACDRSRPAPLQPATAAAADPTATAPFRMLVWNVNSGVTPEPQAELEVIVEGIESQPGAAIYALSEVHPGWVRALTAAADQAGASTYDATLSETGRQQRLLLLVDTERFRPLEINELHRINADGRGRSPIGALLEDRETGEELFVVVVHLRRGNASARQQEAAALREFVGRLDVPTLLLGDFNMDCDADVEEVAGCNDAYEALTSGGAVVWRPHQSREATHCSRGRYNSVLDYVFVAGEATRWQVDVQTQERSTWCRDAMGRGAHLPLTAVVVP